MIPEIIFTFFGVIFLAITIIVIFLTRAKTKNLGVPLNASMIEIDKSRTSFTNGHARGLVKNIHKRPNGTFYITFYPRDTQQGKKAPVPELQEFICSKENLKPSARNDISQHREIIQTISRSPLDVPESLMGTQEGDLIAEEGQKAYLKKISGKFALSQDRDVADFATEFSANIGKIQVNKLRDLARTEREIKEGSPREDKK